MLCRQERLYRRYKRGTICGGCGSIVIASALCKNPSPAAGGEKPHWKIPVDHTVMQNINQTYNDIESVDFQRRIIRRRLQVWIPAQITEGLSHTALLGERLNIDPGRSSNHSVTARRTSAFLPTSLWSIIVDVLMHIDIRENQGVMAWLQLRATNTTYYFLVDELFTIPQAYIASQVRRWRSIREGIQQDAEWGYDIAYLGAILRASGINFSHGYESVCPYTFGVRWHRTTPRAIYRGVGYRMNVRGGLRRLFEALSFCRRFLLRRNVLAIARDEELRDRS